MVVGLCSLYPFCRILDIFPFHYCTTVAGRLFKLDNSIICWFSLALINYCNCWPNTGEVLKACEQDKSQTLLLSANTYN